MFMSKLKLGAAAVLAAGIVCGGAGITTYGVMADGKDGGKNVIAAKNDSANPTPPVERHSPAPRGPAGRRRGRTVRPSPAA